MTERAYCLQNKLFGMDFSMGNAEVQLIKDAGGESGIRPHVTLSSKHAFQACAFSHSAISPRKRTVLMTKNYVGSCCRCLDFMVQRWEAQQQQTAVSTQHSANSLNDGWALITRCDPLCASVVE